MEPLPHPYTPSSPGEAAGASDLDTLWGGHPPQLHWSRSPDGFITRTLVPYTWALVLAVSGHCTSIGVMTFPEKVPVLGWGACNGALSVPVTSFLVFTDDFCGFAEMYPDFAEDYLYPDQTQSDSCAQTPPAPTPNGFCIDFSPETSDFGRKNSCKKVD